MAIEHTIDPAAGGLLADLNRAQREAVTSEAQPLCILAGAGCGKTRVLTRRIAYRVVTGSADAGHVLAVTFTRKAAEELRQRISALGIRGAVTAGTFHSLAFAQLRQRCADLGRRPPAVLDRKGRILGPMLARRPQAAALHPADVALEIEWAKARGIAPSRYEPEAIAAGRTPPVSPVQLAAIYQQYEDEKRRRGLVDFDDLLAAAADALDGDAGYAAAVRWRFRHLFVDEFQDLNPLQFRLLSRWLGEGSDLCVVGDPNQAIYAWNGANPDYLTSFGRYFPGGDTVRLTDNYRSTPQVLAVANALLEDSALLDDSTLRLRAAAPDGDIPTVRAYDTDVIEARQVARAIRGGHSPARPWSHVAVLCRTNAQAVTFERALREAQIPVRVRGNAAFLDQPDVRDALRSLRHAPAAVPFTSLLADLQASAHGDDERLASIEALVRLGHEYASIDERPAAAGFEAWLVATVRGGDDTAGGDAVEIATFHRAKGLEWPVVFVTGLERGFVPIARAETPEAEAEERRLLYVALTRAERELHCSWAQLRTFGTRSVPRQPSPWVATIEAAASALRQASSDPAEWKARVAAERARLGPSRRPARLPGGNADPGLLAALKSWRAAVAQSSKVPPYVIFHDTTLAVVAEARPQTKDDLLALPGLGPVKAERYGADLLQVVARAS